MHIKSSGMDASLMASTKVQDIKNSISTTKLAGESSAKVSELTQKSSNVESIAKSIDTSKSSRIDLFA